MNDIADERRVHAACVDALYAPAFGDKTAKAIASEVKVFDEVLGGFKAQFDSFKTPEAFKLAWPGVESGAKDFLAAVDTYHEHLVRLCARARARTRARLSADARAPSRRPCPAAHPRAAFAPRVLAPPSLRAPPRALTRRAPASSHAPTHPSLRSARGCPRSSTRCRPSAAPTSSAL